jgi:putative nucleotidyltransferase with HDIG domain
VISLSDLSKEIDHLDPIPISLPRLASAVADPDADLHSIVSIIEYDPALTANTLKLANSAYYSSGSLISSVREAVQRLGAGRILQHSLGHRLRTKMAQSCPGYDLEEQELWRHSVAAAVAADLMPRYATTSIHPVSFTAALLHDVGKLVLSRHLSPQVKEAIQRASRVHRLSYVEAERAVLGFDHAQVGGVMARRWVFPEILASAIARHHHPHTGTGDRAALLAVHTANAVAKLIGIGMGSEEMNMPVDSAAAQELGLTANKLEALCAATQQEFPKIIELFDDVHHNDKVTARS